MVFWEWAPLPNVSAREFAATGALTFQRLSQPLVRL